MGHRRHLHHLSAAVLMSSGLLIAPLRPVHAGEGVVPEAPRSVTQARDRNNKIDPKTVGEWLEQVQTLITQGRYEEAIPFQVKLLAWMENTFGPEDASTATMLHNLGFLYAKHGSFERARIFYLRALAIREKVLGPIHVDTAASLDGVASVYYDKGEYLQAELFSLRALGIREKC